MKTIKKISTLFLLLVGIFSFTTIETKTSKNGINLDQIDVIEALNKEYFECRPSSKIMFYVESTVEKKSRGYNVVKADIKVLDRQTGNTKLLASQSIVIANNKDAILEIPELSDARSTTELTNGDILLHKNNTNKYQFNDLVKYNSLYNSYVNSTNKLLNTSRLNK
ncbi:hypothetical protein [Polaribacter sp. MED152]|uniref:hypothetical protein n=1 Tax=Polaribacter sp. MED152 TaxID=313598 RepID=UPI000068C9A8|nr:hypothetical protein [Polaribacter sp. MED152]EAQ42001.1 hypothetical protein MED152_04765 [Polaribacter sp. MED152]